MAIDFDCNDELKAAGELLEELGYRLREPQDLEQRDLVNLFNQLNTVTRTIGLIVSVDALIDMQEPD